MLCLVVNASVSVTSSSYDCGIVMSSNYLFYFILFFVQH